MSGSKPAAKPVGDSGRERETKHDQIDHDLNGRSERMRAMLGGVMSRERRRKRPVKGGPLVLPVGELRQGELGPYHALSIDYAVDHCHGHAPVADALRVPGELLATLALDASLAEVDLSRMLILDTETTGLSGGAGTVPFLIGLSFFEDGCLKVEQLFLRNLGEEAPLLHVLADRIAQASCVVSYNGKSFDWPLLRSRFILNRVPSPILPPHLDLLHCARRVWKERMQAVRLMDVEEQMLGFFRQDDVGGAAIPGIYMDYLRGGDTAPVVSVLEHNEHDVVALPAMLGLMGKHFRRARGGGTPEDQLSFAKVAARAGDHVRAKRFAKAAAEVKAERDSTSVSCRAEQLLAEIARKEREPDVSIEHLMRARSLAEAGSVVLSEIDCALAKLYEHHLRDFSGALEFAMGSESAEGSEVHGRRCARLTRKQLRHQSGEA